MNPMNNLKMKLHRLTQNRMQIGFTLAREQNFEEIELLQQSCAYLDKCIYQTRVSMSILAGQMWADTVEGPAHCE